MPASPAIHRCRDPPPRYATALVVELWDAEGSLRAPLGSHLAHEPRTRVGGVNSTQTFGWDLKLAPWGELAVVTASKRYEIRAFATDGTLVAEYFPAFASVMSDRTGHLWVREYERGAPPFGRCARA